MVAGQAEAGILSAAATLPFKFASSLATSSPSNVTVTAPRAEPPPADPNRGSGWSHGRRQAYIDVSGLPGSRGELRTGSGTEQDGRERFNASTVGRTRVGEVQVGPPRDLQPRYPSCTVRGVHQRPVSSTTMARNRCRPETVAPTGSR